MVEIRTARLTLRRITRQDIPAIVAGLNDYEVSKWLTVVPFPYEPKDAEWFLDHLDARGQFDGFGLTRDGGPVMGVVGIDTSLGYWLGRAHHGRGYMTEAATALVDDYFKATGVNTLASGYFDGNAASAKVLEKLGFQPIGAQRVTSRARGAEITLNKMALTRVAWEARDAG